MQAIGKSFTVAVCLCAAALLAIGCRPEVKGDYFLLNSYHTTAFAVDANCNPTGPQLFPNDPDEARSYGFHLWQFGNKVNGFLTMPEMLYVGLSPLARLSGTNNGGEVYVTVPRIPATDGMYFSLALNANAVDIDGDGVADYLEPDLTKRSNFILRDSQGTCLRYYDLNHEELVAWERDHYTNGEILTGYLRSALLVTEHKWREGGDEWDREYCLLDLGSWFDACLVMPIDVGVRVNAANRYFVLAGHDLDQGIQVHIPDVYVMVGKEDHTPGIDIGRIRLKFLGMTHTEDFWAGMGFKVDGTLIRQGGSLQLMDFNVHSPSNMHIDIENFPGEVEQWALEIIDTFFMWLVLDEIEDLIEGTLDDILEDIEF